MLGSVTSVSCRVQWRWIFCTFLCTLLNKKASVNDWSFIYLSSQHISYNDLVSDEHCTVYVTSVEGQHVCLLVARLLLAVSGFYHHLDALFWVLVVLCWWYTLNCGVVKAAMLQADEMATFSVCMSSKISGENVGFLSTFKTRGYL